MLLAAAALLIGASSARAVVPVELPAGQDPALWEPAIEMARQVLPDLVLGPALGPGPSVRVVPGVGVWLLDIAGAHGRSAPLPMPVPESDEARIELLLVCADLLSRGAPAPEAPAAPAIAPPPPPASPWRWVPPRIAGLARVAPADAPPFELAIEPSGLGWHALALAPRLALSAPATLPGDLGVRAGQVGVALRASTGERPVLAAGLDGGLALASLRRNEVEVLRDWSAALGASGGVGLALPRQLAAIIEVRGGVTLPPVEVVSGGEVVPLPDWSLQVGLAVALRGIAAPPPGVATPWGPLVGGWFPRSEARSGYTLRHRCTPSTSIRSW